MTKDLVLKLVRFTEVKRTYLYMAAVRDFYSKRTCLLAQTSLINESRLLAQSPRIRNSLRYLLIRVARPISMCLHVQARSVTWLMSGTFIVNKARLIDEKIIFDGTKRSR